MVGKKKLKQTLAIKEDTQASVRNVLMHEESVSSGVFALTDITLSHAQLNIPNP